MKRNVSLDAGARLLLEEASADSPPSEDACRRMSLKLAPMLAAGAGSMLLKPSVEVAAALNRGSATGLWGWEKLTGSAWGKLAFAVLTSALMVGAFCLGRVTSRRAEPVLAAMPPVLSTAQLSVKTELVRADHERPIEPAPSFVPVTVPPASVSKPKAGNTSRSVDGLTILGEVELSLRQRNPRAALARLDELGEPASRRLRHLSRVLRAIALCDAGRLDEGRGMIGQLGGDQGSSVFAARLDRACEKLE